MRVSREISLGSSLHRASTDALIIIMFIQFVYKVLFAKLLPLLSYTESCESVS